MKVIRWGLSILAFLGITLLTPFSIFDFLKSNLKKEPERQLVSSRQPLRLNARRNSETQTFLQQTRAHDVQLTRLMQDLNDLYLDSDKLTLIENRVDLLPPNSLPLGKLNSILDSFYLDSDKLKVTEILQPRLKDYYSEREREEFKNHYYLDSDKLDAIRLLDEN